MSDAIAFSIRLHPTITVAALSMVLILFSAGLLASSTASCIRYWTDWKKYKDGKR